MLLNNFQSFLAGLKSRRLFTQLRHHKRNRFYDKRTSTNRIAALESLEERTLLSSTSFIYTPGAYLTNPSTADAETIARGYLSSHPEVLGATSADVSNLILTDRVPGAHGNVTNLYFQQTYQGIPIDAGTTNVTVDSQGRIISVGNRLVSDVNDKVIAGGATLTPAQAVYFAAGSLKTAAPEGVILVGTSTTYDNEVENFSGGNLSLDDIPVKLIYNLGSDDKLHLAWNTIVRMTTGADWFYINVDATTGQQLYINNWTHYDDFDSSTPGSLGGETLGGETLGGGSSAASSGSSSSSDSLIGGNSGSPGSQFATGDSNSNLGTGTYNVYPLPITDPNDGSRSLVTDPQDYRASPYGWHDTDGIAGADFTTTQGNNVYAQEDADHNNTGGFRPDGGPGLNFDYGLDLSQSPTSGTNQSAEITQLFYTVNMLHDIHYQYGFDETSGNFQVNNYGKGGVGNDQVNADAQDGGGTNNANFSTPVDGLSGRMQMYIWNLTTPNRDGDLSTDIIIHEFGHGISNRLTGGASTPNTLSALQSGGMGEGWSDFWSLMLTQRPTDTQMGSDPLGTWVLGQSGTDVGIRHYPYSYDMTVNPLTLGNYNYNPEVHGAGEVWTSALWDLNWLYINRYGYSNDLYDGNGGNNMLLQTVMDALKIQPANPSFLDARDAILAADVAATGGINQDIIWQAFARRGMGVYASDGGANSKVVGENFNVPGDSVDDFADTPVQASLINSNSLTSGGISSPTDVDYLKFNAKPGEHFDIQIAHPADHFVSAPSATLTLYDHDGTTLLSSGDNLSFNAPSDGIFYIKVSDPVSSELGGYSVRLINDDYGSSSATARLTRVMSLNGGDFEAVGDSDWFAFPVTSGQTVYFQTALYSMPDSTMTLYSTDGVTQLAFNDNYNPANGQYFSYFNYTFGSAGTYYIKVGSAGNLYDGKYGLYIYNGATYDAVGNDAVSAAAASTPNVNANWTLDVLGDSDWARYYLTAGHKYNFQTILGTLPDSTLTLFDHDGRTQVAFNDDTVNGGYASSLYYTPERSGYFYIRAAAYNDNYSGTFTLQSTDSVVDDYSDIHQFAATVGVHSLTAGNLEVAGDVDYFKFHALAGLTYDLDNDRLTLPNSIVAVLGPDGTTQLDASDGGGSGDGITPHISFTAPTTGDYYIRIQGYDGTQSGTYTLEVNERNAAPVLVPNNNSHFPTIAEDPVDATNTGLLISQLIANLNPGGISDANQGALQGIALVIADNSFGDWQYSSDDGVNWSYVGAVNVANALLLPSDPGWRLRFVPDPDFNGNSPDIHFVAWDRTNGTPASIVDASTRGGTTPFSTDEAYVDITVTPVNDAPVLTNSGNPKLPTITEDPVDASNTGMLISQLIANLRATTGTLSDVDTGPLEGLAFSGADQANGIWQYSLNNGTNWSDFGTTSASAARLLASDSQTRIRFKPIANYFGSSTVTFVAWDQTSGTNGNTASVTTRGGTTAFSLGYDTASIAITSVNDAPVLSAAGAPTLTSIAEDSVDASNPGTLVSLILANFISSGGTYTDDDPSASRGIAVTSVDNTKGTWQYTTDNGTNWLDFGTTTASAARLLASAAGTKVRFRPNADYNGTATFQFVAWDQTAGTNGQTGIATNRGGSKPYSTAVKAATITITPVNDAPVLGNTAVGNPTLNAIPRNISDATNTGTLISQILTNFNSTGGTFTDVDAGALKGIAVTSVTNTNGTWQYTTDNGLHWLDFGTPTASAARLLASVPGTKMRFKPNTGFTGTATFLFVGWDQSSGTNGTTAIVTNRGGIKPYSLGSDTGSISVFIANTAPTFNTNGNPTLTNITKDIPDASNTGTLISTIIANLTSTGGSITDPDAGALQGIAVTSVNNANGIWQYTINGTNWLDFGSPAAATARLLASDDNTRIRFKPATGYTGTATFLFVAWDQSSGVNGGTLSATTRGNATPFSTGYDTAVIAIQNPV